jgi:peptidoglycan/LPS O-acetylase OafA/YrhL
VSGRIPALDGLRGIAIAAVLLFHATGWPAGGGLGVTLFFVLSGFLITTLLLERDESMTMFWKRRARRLVPALFAMLAAYLVITGDVAPTLVGATYGMNILGAYGGDTGDIGHLWSLSIEEQFYLVWPIVLLVLVRKHRRAALAVTLLGLALVTARSSWIYLDADSFDFDTWKRIWYGSDTAVAPILVGCGIALLPWRRFPSGYALPALVGFLALSLIPMSAYALPGALLVASIVCAVLVASAAGDPGWLGARPVVFVGQISYSAYVWHALVFLLLGVETTRWGVMSLPAIAATILVAYASYRFIEQPFLRGRSRLEQTVALRPADAKGS